MKAIYGGYGYIGESEVERMYPDAKIVVLREGTGLGRQVILADMVLNQTSQSAYSGPKVLT
jgi:alkylation response protein AidB-like acyl-CoA dehydrogenase